MEKYEKYLNEKNWDYLEGDKIKINYGQYKGKTGLFLEYSPSGEFAIIKVGAKKISIDTSDINKLNENISLAEIRKCVKEIIKHHPNKSKSINFEDICDIASKYHFYKDDLPEIQSQIEDAGYDIDYDF
jgi:ribosomal protein L24